MKQKKRIDKIIETIEPRLQDEVGALLGADFALIGGENKSISKEDVFAGLLGKQICSQMDISGEVTGKGCLLIGIKDAIRLGGTLIMLPANELEEAIGREDYSEELEDSYGEISNIIAGAFTKDFEEMYPKSCRFIRKEQEIVAPAKVVVEGDSPIENQFYYQVSFSMVLDGRQMGNLLMLLPAASFGLEEEIKNDALDERVKKTAESVAEPAAASADVLEDLKREEIQGSDTEPEPQKEPVRSPKFDVEKHQKKVNTLLAECQKKVANEVSALLGVDISLTDLDNRLLSKEKFFEENVAGRHIFADMQVEGEAEGKSFLAISVKDAIHLGGILIMLPPTELEKVVMEEEFGADAQDAYGEIANIISGVYTAVFEEQYHQKLRFIRKDLKEVIPAKIEIESDEPIEDIAYYVSSSSVAVDGEPLSRIHMLIPAKLLLLDTPKVQFDKGVGAEKGGIAAGINDHRVAETAKNLVGDGPLPEKSPKVDVAAAPIDPLKQKKLIDKILLSCKDRMADEVSALLGIKVSLTGLENILVSKEEFFFDEVSGKQVIANMDVMGELEGKSYLSVCLRDAIRIGGFLIMLPDSELESIINDEEFSEDLADAYGEIANIISGVYSAVFEEKYNKQIRFVKTDLQQVSPMKVDISGTEPIPDQDYYLSRMDLTMGEHKLGKLNVLFPAELLQLSGLRAGSGLNDSEEEKSLPVEHQTADSYSSLDILVVGDDGIEAARIVEVLGRSGYSVKSITFKDNLHNYVPGNLKAIYLVMRDVNEQAFGLAIKVSSACAVPLIAAGPDWTRKKVIKAVKYGVRDILLTPASDKDIEDNLNYNLLELAA